MRMQVMVRQLQLHHTYSGADAGNYSFTDQSTTTGNIVPKALTAQLQCLIKLMMQQTATATLTLSGLSWIRNIKYN